jgi:hypothetical protein
MTPASGYRWFGAFQGLVDWWRNLRASCACLDELQSYGADIEQIARKVGPSRLGFYMIAAKLPGTGDQLKERLAALHIAMLP